MGNLSRRAFVFDLNLTMIYTNAHRSALNQHLAQHHPYVARAVHPDSRGSLHLICRELPAYRVWFPAKDSIEVEDLARAYFREHGCQMPVFIRVNNITSGELRHEYLVNYIDYRNRRDMREVERLVRMKQLFLIG